MTRVTYQGAVHEVRPGQTVLEALLEGGAEIAHSCRAGACGACLVQATAGQIPELAQLGLRETWRARGYLYACMCRPTEDLALEPLGDGARVTARVVSRLALSASVTRLRIGLDAALPARPGQYVTLRRGGVARSYSIAALPAPDQLELHVRHLPGGQLSPYLCTQAQPGDELTVQGPMGDCVYVAGRPEQPLLLAGTGTGLAPLWGVLHDALDQGHRGPIHLFHGALDAAGLYLVEELRELAARHDHVEYSASVLSDEQAPPGILAGSLEQVIARRLPRTVGMRAFLCGDPTIVMTLKKKLFLSGTALRDLAADAFLPTAAPARAAP
jgi:CDP-4-dehydro-6-deoxyglucose reductase, E3